MAPSERELPPYPHLIHILRSDAGSAEELEEEKVKNEEEEAELPQPPTETDDVIPSEATPTPDEVDGEEEEEGSSEEVGEEGDSSELSETEDEDDDLHQLVQTLQNFVRESSEPPPLSLSLSIVYHFSQRHLLAVQLELWPVVTWSLYLLSTRAGLTPVHSQ